MSNDNVPCAWWHTPRLMEPLEVVRTVLRCLEAGEPVPAEAAKPMAVALRQYLEGSYDLTANLGLRPRRGGRYEAPLTMERTERRNEVIRSLVALQDGPKTVRCRKVADMLRDAPGAGCVTESDVTASVIELCREFGTDLPTSMRQVLRISDGK